MDANNVQERILKECVAKKIPVTLFLMNGFQLKGTIPCFDALVVVLAANGKQQMIYKHAISTIVPEKAIAI